MRAESLATTEADFSKTLLDRQEEAQRHLNELSAQLSQTRHTQCKLRSAGKEKEKETITRVLSSTHEARGSFPACQMHPSPKSGGLMFARRRRPCPIDELCSESSESSSTSDATTATETRAAHSQLTRWSGPTDPEKTQLRSKRTRLPNGDLQVGRVTRRCPRFECRSVGRHCFAWRCASTAGGKIDAVMTTIGFTRSTFDVCVYSLRSTAGSLEGILCVHVDDTICGGSGTLFSKALLNLRHRFPFRKWQVGEGTTKEIMSQNSHVCCEKEDERRSC